MRYNLNSRKTLLLVLQRFNGQSVGIVANQPSAYAGALDANASRKGARFVRFCDAFNIPIVSLVDVPGFPSRYRPGIQCSYLTRCTVVLRLWRSNRTKDNHHPSQELWWFLTSLYGLQAIASDLTLFLAKFRDCSYGSIGQSCSSLRKEAKQVKESGGDVKQFIAEKEEEYTEKFGNPYQAAQYGYIDDVIEPRNTRFRICRGLAQLANKKQELPAKKHGCMPM